MEDNRGLREGLTKADDLEVLGRVLRRREFRGDHEAEPMVVPMIAEEDASLGALLTECLKTRPNELATHAASLKLGLHGHRAEGEPPALRRGTHVRERDMADDLLAKHGDERQG